MPPGDWWSEAIVDLAAARRLSRADWVAVLTALWALPVAAVLLRALGLQRVLSRLASAPRRGVAEPTALRVGWLVNRVAGLGPYRFNCLKRSVVTLWMAQRRGNDVDLRIGVRREVDAFGFHAWVESDGVVINDNADIGTTYTPFEGAFPAGARF